MIVDLATEEQHLTMDEDSLLVVRVGSDARPASEQDITEMQKAIKQLGIKNLKGLVTHHDVDFQVLQMNKKK